MKKGLFTFHPHSPGSPFFLPHGTRIVQKLKDFLRREYKRYGFQEVITPQLFNKKLWQVSGHWDNYKQDMFVIQDQLDEELDHDLIEAAKQREQGVYIEGIAEIETNGLKPMNCPGHCLLFADSSKSYRDLPLRFAEFSPLHRNEASGALTGLTRVRKFHQDDGHIFCTKEQIKEEIEKSLEFMDKVYKKIGFSNYSMSLSTRPIDNYIGQLSDWNSAEDSLKHALDATGKKWNIKDGDGAFYGPKIDIMIEDAVGKTHQTATIQLDFQLPSRFKLSFIDDAGNPSTPVIIHRAILGSIERMMAILIENYNGKWPFWLSPRQVIIVTTRSDLKKHAAELKRKIDEVTNFDFYIDVDHSDNTLPKQIRDAQVLAYNYIFVLGDREIENGTITVRSRNGKNLGEMEVEELVKMMKQEAT